MLEDILRKIKLKQDISIEIPLSKAQFKTRLHESVDTRKYNLFEQFSSSEKVFIGELSDEGFKIRPVKKIFQNNLAYLSWFTGNYDMRGSDKTFVSGEISVSKYFPILILVIMLLGYIPAIVTLTFLSNMDTIVVFFIFFHGLVMLSIFYFILRRSINLGKRYMERELFFLSKNN